MPIEPKTVKNIRQMTERSEDSDLKKWIIFPGINGTILMESKSGDATISVGNTDFSYTSPKAKGSHKRLMTASLLNVMRQIAA